MCVNNLLAYAYVAQSRQICHTNPFTYVFETKQAQLSGNHVILHLWDTSKHDGLTHNK